MRRNGGLPLTNPPPLPEVNPREGEKGYKFPVLPAKRIFEIIQKECAPSVCQRYGSGKNTVVILPEAWDELSQMINFGRRSAVNSYEQHYQGVGHFFINSDRSVVVVVTHFLYIYSASRGPTFAKVVSGSDDTMLDRLENERMIYNKLEAQCNSDENGYNIDPFLRYGSSEVVLFGHTHPGLSCFFSATDRDSNYATPSCPLCTFVCDPIKKDMKAMVGVDESPAKVIVLQKKEKGVCSELKKANEKQIQQTITERQAIIKDLATHISEELKSLGASVTCKAKCNWRGTLRVDFRMVCRPNRRNSKH